MTPLLRALTVGDEIAEKTPRTWEWAPPLRIGLGRRRVNAYRFMGVIGYVAAVVVGGALAAIEHRSIAVLGILAAIDALLFLLVAVLTQRLMNEEYIVYFHHEIAIIVTSIGILRVMRAPLLPYLDVTTIGILVFLGFGRVGCLRVGCCYGKPVSFGVRYDASHVEAGFPAELQDVTLLPVQALESAIAFSVAAVGGLLVLHARPGIAMAWCVTAYGAARFFILEPLRGDPRPNWRGVSHAQWLAAGRAAAILIGMGTHTLPWSRPVGALACAPAAVALARASGGGAR